MTNLNNQKNLKVSSIVVLIFAGFTLTRLILELCLGELNRMPLPEGAPDNTLLIAKIILFSFSCLLLLPQVFVGVKGILIAKKPNASKVHIIVAIALLACTVLTLGTPVINILNNVSVLDNLGDLFGIMLDAIVLYEYVKYAVIVSKQA